MSIEETIHTKLAQALQPIRLHVVNESGKHKGHAGDNGTGESHFHVEIVSDSFSGKGRIERQRMIYALLDDELKGGLHALSLKALSPSEDA